MLGPGPMSGHNCSGRRPFRNGAYLVLEGSDCHPVVMVLLGEKGDLRAREWEARSRARPATGVSICAVSTVFSFLLTLVQKSLSPPLLVKARAGKVVLGTLH